MNGPGHIAPLRRPREIATALRVSR